MGSWLFSSRTEGKKGTTAPSIKEEHVSEAILWHLASNPKWDLHEIMPFLGKPEESLCFSNYSPSPHIL